MISTLDIAWLAGLIEGEGCIRTTTSNYKYHYPRIRVKMADKDVIEKAVSMLGGTIVTVCKEKNDPGYWKQAYSTDIAGKKAAGWLMTIFPLMGKRRQAKIREVLIPWLAL